MACEARGGEDMNAPRNAVGPAGSEAEAMDTKKKNDALTIGTTASTPNHFGPVPVAAARALAAGAFPSGLKGFGVLSYVYCVGWCDGVVETSISKLVEDTAWQNTPKALRMLLVALHADGWILSL